MTDELSQNIISGLVGDNDNFLDLKGEYARNLWFFINHPDKFKEAEYFSSHDSKRKSRQWSSYECPRDKEIQKTSGNIEEFKERSLSLLNTSRNIKIEFYDRERIDEAGSKTKSIQLVAFHDGLQKIFSTFDQNGIDILTQAISPVAEFSIIYEPEKGVIEVISDHKNTRSLLAKTFVNSFLKTKSDIEEITLKKYDLSKLYQYYDFIKDADSKDQIDEVKITSLRLKPLAGDGFITTIESTLSQRNTIYESIKECYGIKDSLSSTFQITKARLSIKFKSDIKSPRGKTLHVNITAPNNCDLKEKTEKERLIGNKYMLRWGLVSNILLKNDKSKN